MAAPEFSHCLQRLTHQCLKITINHSQDKILLLFKIWNNLGACCTSTLQNLQRAEKVNRIIANFTWTVKFFIALKGWTNFSVNQQWNHWYCWIIGKIIASQKYIYCKKLFKLPWTKYLKSKHLLTVNYVMTES